MQNNSITWWPYLRGKFQGRSAAILFILICALFQAGANYPIPLMVRHAFDTLIPQRRMEQLVLTGVGLATLYAAGILCGVLVKRFGLKTATAAARQMRLELLDAASFRPPESSAARPIESIQRVIVYDTEKFQATAMECLTRFIPAILVTLGVLAVLFGISPVLTTMLGISVLASGYFTRKFHRKVMTTSNELHRELTYFADAVHFTLIDHDLTKTQNAENDERDRRDRLAANASAAALRKESIQTSYTQLHQGLLFGLGVLMMVIGGFMVSAGKISLGELLSFSVALAMLNVSAKTILTLVPHIIQARDSLRRICDVLNESMPEPRARPAQPLRVNFSGTIRMSEVSFHYPSGPWILEDVSLDLEPGKIVAISGPNGCGKSTLVNLILALIEPQKGSMHADDQSYEELDVSSLRRYISLVRQNPRFLPGTIFENFTYGNSISESEIQTRLDEFGIADLVASIPVPWDKYLGPDAKTLSGGQKQKLAIARALIRRPRILILDEPTNHLDGTSIQLLLETLKKKVPDLAILIVSHNRAMLGLADTVYEIRERRLRAIRPAEDILSA
jgi:ATP-binding cassette subfamily B protein